MVKINGVAFCRNLKVNCQQEAEWNIVTTRPESSSVNGGEQYDRV